MKAREVLGVDFCGDRLLVAQVRRDPNGLVLTRWAGRTVPAAAASTAVAETLGALLTEEGFSATAVVMGLPAGRGFLRLTGPDREAGLEAFSSVDYATDRYSTPDGRVVWGVAARADVARAREVAALAGLELLGVQLRATGALEALGLGSGAARPAGPAVGLIVSETHVTLCVVDGPAVLAVHTRPRPVGGRLERWLGAVDSSEQMFHLLRLSQPAAAGAAVRAIVNADDRQAVEVLGDRIGGPVELTGLASAADIRIEGKGPEAAGDYAAAVGLALSGLRGRVGAMDFLRAREPARSRWTFSWRKGGIAAAAALVVLLAGLAGTAAYRRRQLAALESAAAGRQVRRGEYEQTRRRLRELGPWAHGRVRRRRILDEIGGLFPADARADTLTVIAGEAPGAPVVRIDGRAADTKALHEFVARANRSEAFERALLGDVTDEAGGEPLKKRFSVTFVAGRREAR